MSACGFEANGASTVGETKVERLFPIGSLRLSVQGESNGHVTRLRHMMTS